MLNKVKEALRLSHSALDDEVLDLIEACKMDLKISGIKKIDDTDPLIIRAIIVYCKSEFGFDNADSEKFKSSYEALKTHLALCGDYNVL